MAQHRLHNPLTPYLFLSPFLLIIGVFVAYPLLQSINLSLHQTFGPGYQQFVFLDNFLNLLRDPLFWKALRNTLTYAVATLFIQMPLALGLALLLNQPWLRGRVFLRLIFFSPALVGPVFVGFMSTIVFAGRVGLLNRVLNGLFGFNPDYAWLQNHVMGSLIIAGLWMYVGFNMIFFLAALQNVDGDLLDAARIDGAKAWQRFIHVILPSIRPVVGFVVLLSLIGSFQLFELPFVLLNQSAGPDYQGLTIVMYLYQNGFEIGDLGYASAIGWVLAVILIVLTGFQRFYFGRKEED